MRWYHIKSWVADSISLSHDAMHVHVGLFIFFVLLWLFRRSPRRLALAWALTLAATLFNEALDAYDWILWTGTINWMESLKDTVNTMFWPTLTAIAVNHWRRSNRLSTAEKNR
ncbi:hypothetical protein JYU29_02990 [Tianweitania sp. BSSL-BM11]|uniref:VanZ-like domain-containing protein n=1 Tax=Tianweitania aestuarii TaxID=2814886 RepID=A0ABS5RRG6_9HYPH|nr:hypothetical protein [Tianweitania aestuarii]MBS9719648.1 hypothetical protein [Tianweitania aestuarii]